MSQQTVDIAERQVAQFLERIPPASRPELVTTFPRDLLAVTQEAFPNTPIDFVQIAGLSDAKVAAHLRKLGRRQNAIREDARLMGHIRAYSNCVYIFSDPSFGKATERFTWAHEIGHLFLEIRKTLPSADQLNLFSSETEQAIAASRDPIGFIPHDGPTVRRQLEKNEIYANCFASALLMPRSEVLRESGGEADIERLTRRVQDCFEVSRTAAQSRLKELGLIDAVVGSEWLFGMES